MASRNRPSVRKREREQMKRQRERQKAEKAAQKRERRLNRTEETPPGSPAVGDIGPAVDPEGGTPHA